MIQIEQVPAYLVWPVRHEVMYPEMDFASIKLAEDENGMHMALFDNNQLISVISLFRTGAEMQFRKFATLNQYQGKGYGSALLKHVIAMAKEENVVRLWCNAPKNATVFYKKFGFHETANIFSKDEYEFVVMEQIF